MENYERQIFESTGLDETARTHLLETVRWTKFMAILGFIVSGILLLMAIAMLILGRPLSSPAYATYSSGAIIGIIVGYIIGIGLYIYPVYALFQFSTNMKKGILNDDRTLVNDAFRHQKNMYKYTGIISIIIIALYLVLIIAAMLKSS